MAKLTRCHTLLGLLMLYITPQLWGQEAQARPIVVPWLLGQKPLMETFSSRVRPISRALQHLCMTSIDSGTARVPTTSQTLG